ncbi:methyl-accepting chemotaxis protein [Marinomonas piezotolerans]|uniref:Methyl-accepting chemotaxis protein n=1 Tax=Marinomonas piezotolerans TaxID=2213058 RepID=A0A370UAK6_9GAMM|nr:HAMP domain-containing methyl-accepting chemotaxis protein [Marinomonas piezotolerans]RDL44810.1 methyl-accepting chemotaxis protein [Marinomonas piezotolerans]
MLNNLSFRAKLVCLLICAVIGFALVTVVAIDGMQSQQTSNAQLQRFGQIQTTVDKMSLGILEAADQLRSLNDATYEAYSQTLTQEKDEDLSRLEDEISHAARPDLKEALVASQTTLQSYSNALLDLAYQRSIIGFDSQSGLKSDIVALGDDVSKAIEKLNLLKREFVNVRQAEGSYLAEPRPDILESLNASFKRFMIRVENFGFKDTIGVVAEKYHNTILSYGDAYKALQDAEQRFTDEKVAFGERQEVLSALLAKYLQQAEQYANEQSQQSLITLISVSVLVSIVSIILMLSIGRSARNTLMRIVADLTKVKDGDMTAKARINTKRNDEFDALSTSLNEMTSGLGNVLSEVVGTTSNVSQMINGLNSAINNIADNNRSVNQRTHSLAGATEDISHRITQLSSTTNELREHSSETYESAKAGADTIRVVLDNLKGTVEAVNLTSQQLDELGRSSTDIDNVIGMINDLANQTNLLALNAAIEAARAGEAGRGFSVVADEVRALAEKTVDATSRITEIVSSIQSSTQTAISSMEQGKERLQIIEQNGGQAEDAIRIIEANAQTSAHSSDSMATAIQDVANTAVGMSSEMEQIAKQLGDDTQSIEQIVDSAQQIHKMAQALADKTRVFTL